jgi:DNA-binding MarR family transcriptional regulator
MVKKLRRELNVLSDKIAKQADDLRVNTIVSFAYTADMVNRYLDIELRKDSSKRIWSTVLHTLITHNGSMAQTELSKRIFRSKNSVTSAINMLERKGLVKRVASEQDHRIKLVTITEKGINSMNRIVSHRKEVNSRAIAFMNDQELKQFSEILKRFRQHMFNILDKN